MTAIILHLILAIVSSLSIGYSIAKILEKPEKIYEHTLVYERLRAKRFNLAYRVSAYDKRCGRFDPYYLDSIEYDLAHKLAIELIPYIKIEKVSRADYDLDELIAEIWVYVK